MSILLWITIEMEYKIKCLKFILFFTNGCQKLTVKGLSHCLLEVLLNNAVAMCLFHCHHNEEALILFGVVQKG